MPAYLPGRAYLMARRSPEAAREFQKILNHRGIVFYSRIFKSAESWRCACREGVNMSETRSNAEANTTWERRAAGADPGPVDRGSAFIHTLASLRAVVSLPSRQDGTLS